MDDILEITEVHWANDTKTRVSCLVKYNNGTSEQLSVGTNEGSQYWQRILNDYTLEDIDSYTADMMQVMRDRRKVDEYRAQERDAQRKMNAIFNAKIEAFDIPAVASAPSAKKSKIRKAKSVTEVVALVAVCIIESEKANG